MTDFYENELEECLQKAKLTLRSHPHPRSETPGGRPRSRWREWVTQLAWKHLGIIPGELEDVSRQREVSLSLLGLLPPWPGWMDEWMDEWRRAYTSVICEGFCDSSQCYYSSQLSSWWKEHLSTGWMIFSDYSLLFLQPEDQSTTTEHILLLHLPNHDSNVLEGRSPVTELSLSLWERAVKPFRARQLLEVPKILAARYFAKPLDGFN